ncbi:MAG: NERD domain-containing protein/DEAD/DEAH box helicase [Candidatus Eisenbacteria bacterium]|nr:NERD domain-containing protein/DEAD/DEAH box helicase [Candidatus Eisenbacteria bacterium]
MARMIPAESVVGQDGRSASGAEVRVHSALRQTLDDRFTVFGSVAWQSVSATGKPIQGEADFVVCDPRRGFLVLEVKGGRIDHEPRTKTWSSTDRRGARHVIKNPFEQSKRSTRQIKDLLTKRLSLPDLPITAGWGVVFPDAEGDPASVGVEALPDLVALRDDLPQLGARVESMFVRWTGSRSLEPVPSTWPSELEALIAPSCTLPVRLGGRLREASAESNRLTEEQFAVLDGLARNHRVLVTGAAGTGKTMLAVEKARRLCRAGLRTLLTCFNRPLADLLGRDTADLPELVVHNFHQLCYRRALRDGFTGPDPDSDEVRDPARERLLGSEYFDRMLPEAFRRSLAGQDGRFDAIVVDEGQDFSADMQRALIHALREQEAGYLFVFQDEGQSIFGGREGWDHTGMMEFHLSRNLRNSREIHSVLKRLNPSDDSNSAGPGGPPPEFIEVGDSRAAVSAIEDRVRTLTANEGVALRQLAVLTAGRHQLAELAPEGRLGGFATTQDPFGPPGTLYLDRVSRFKGLERDVVILTGLSHPPAHNRTDPLLYVAGSRARAHLIVIDAPAVLARFRPSGTSTT